MNITFDYSDLIQELKEELLEGILTPQSEILIERESIRAMVSVPYEGNRLIHYNAIVDWYYMDEGDDPEGGLEEEFTPEEIASLKERIAFFRSYRNKLELITVEKCLQEMKEMSRTL